MNKRNQKLCSIILSIIMCIMTICTNDTTIIQAATITQSGTSGKVTWSIDSDGLLFLSGSGNAEKTYEKSGLEYYPWYEYRETITSAKVTVSGMTDASGLFEGCTNLTTVDVSEWDTSNVRTMERLFYYCSKMSNIDLSSLNFGLVKSTNAMFCNCDGITNMDMTKWNLEYLSDMENMFINCDNLKQVNMQGLNMPRLQTMAGMFYSCDALTDVNMKEINTGILNSIELMFYECGNLVTLDLSDLDTQYLICGTKAFMNCNKLATIDVSTWNTENMQELDYMFNNCDGLTSTAFISNWDTYRVSTMEDMFAQCNNLLTADLSTLETDKVTNMKYMFSGCSSLTSADIGNWNVSNVTDMERMFAGCNNLEQLNLEKWNLKKLNNVTNLFKGCTKLSCTFSVKTKIDNYTGAFSNAATDSNASIKLIYSGGCDEETASAMIATKAADSNVTMEQAAVDTPQTPVSPETVLHYGEVDGVYWEMDVNGHLTLTGDGSNLSPSDSSPCYPWLQYKKDILSAELSIVNMVNASQLFSGCENMASVDTSKWDTSKVTNMFKMFYGCSKLETLDTSKWDTSKVMNMNNTFNGCKFETLDVSQWDTSSVRFMTGMFSGCKNLKSIDVKNWDTSKVTNMGNVFANCTKLASVDVGQWNTTKVSNMQSMFYNCYQIKQMDLSKWDTSKVTDMSSMFSDCSNLEQLNISTWNVQNVRDMQCMFDGCAKIETLDIGNWDVGMLEYTYKMFADCVNLKELDLSNWKTYSLEDVKKMFQNCKNIVLKLTICNDIDDTEKCFDNAATGENTSISIGFTDDISRETAEELIDTGSGDVNIGLAGVENIHKDITEVILSEPVVDVTGDAACPQVTVVHKGVTLQENKDYSLTYDDNSDFGVKTIVIVGLGNYGGRINANYYIQGQRDWSMEAIDNQDGTISVKIYGDFCQQELDMGITYDTSKLMFANVKWANSLINKSKIATGGTHVYHTYTATANENYEFVHIQGKAEKPVIGNSWADSAKKVPLLTATFMIKEDMNEAAFSLSKDVEADLTKLEQQQDKVLKDVAVTLAECKVTDVGTGEAVYLASGTDGNIQWSLSETGHLTITGDGNLSSNKYNSMPWYPYVDKIKSAKIDVTNMTNASYLFFDCDNLEWIEMSNWDISKVTEMRSTFAYCKKLREVNLGSSPNGCLRDMYGMFYYCTALKSIDLNHINTENVVNAASLFLYCSQLETVKLDKWNTSKMERMDNMFDHCTSLTEIPGIDNWDTASAVSMNNMFEYCENLQALNVSKWDVSKVENMSYMFWGCSALKELDLTNWDTTGLVSVQSMFRECTNLSCMMTVGSKISNYERCFEQAATRENTRIILGYTEGVTEEKAQAIVDTKSENSNVVLRIKPKDGEIMVMLDEDSFYYTGQAICPKATVSYKGTPLVEHVDYEISYGNNVQIGTAVVTASGIDLYDFEIGKSYEIMPISTPTPEPGQTTSPAPDQTTSPEPEPGSSEAPSTSQEPGGSTSPNPNQSAMPGSSTIPSESTNPEVSDNPIGSSQPDSGNKPGNSENPITGNKVMLGDVDANGEITLGDAQTVLKAALKIISLESPYSEAADVDENGQITLADAQQVLKFALRIISEFTTVKAE